MTRQSVSSSSLASVGYSAQEQVLEVEFQNGAIYQYPGVPLDAYTDLLAAASLGAHFNGNIRSKYPFRKCG
jgi:hypothetical protein